MRGHSFLMKLTERRESTLIVYTYCLCFCWGWIVFLRKEPTRALSRGEQESEGVVLNTLLREKHSDLQ